MIFGNKEYKYTRSINFQGKVIGFAAQKNQNNQFEIGCSTLVLSSDDPNDSTSWRDFETLKFSDEVRIAGINVMTFDAPAGGVASSELFDVVTDDLYVYVFRQSTNNTLLVDRFIYDEVLGKLVNAWEVRYRRSQKPDIPAGIKDSFGSTNMEGEYFLEPTTELTMVCNLQSGWFKAMILPTELKNESRWQIFIFNSVTSRLMSYSIKRSENGLFDFSKTATEPEGYLRKELSIGSTPLSIQSAPTASIYNRQERLKDEYGRFTTLKKETRVMLAVSTGSNKEITLLDFGLGKDGILADSNFNLSIPSVSGVGNSLQFSREQKKYVAIPQLSTAPSSALSLEAWIKLSSYSNGADLIVQSASSATIPCALYLQNGCASFYIKNGSSEISAQAASLDTDTWYHLAGTWDGTTATIYVNGVPYTNNGTAPASLEPSTGYYFGGESNGFSGDLNEVRLWDIARSQEEIISNMASPITSSDPKWSNLLAYWQMTEPTDATRLTTVPNSSAAGTAANGVLHGATWNYTNVPMGSSMAPLKYDSRGLSISAVTLSYARTAHRPDIFPGNDGRIHLYYRNESDGAYLVTHLDTMITRAAYQSNWEAIDSNTSSNSQYGQVRFIARQAGTSMNYQSLSGQFLSISAATSGKSDECNVLFKNSFNSQELWEDVPRDVDSFLKIINGDALQLTSDPVALARKLVMYDYSGKITITAGSGQPTLKPQQNIGSYIFSVISTSVPDNGITPLISDTNNTSNFAGLSRAGMNNCWVAEPAIGTLAIGNPVNIEVLSQSQLTNYTGDMDLQDSLTLEAWVNIDQQTSEARSTLFIFNHSSESIQYVMGLNPDGKLYAGKEDNARLAQSAPVPLNTWTHLAATYKTNYGLNLSGTKFLNAGNNESLNTGVAFTAEAWVNASQTGIRQTIASKWDDTSGQSWVLYIDTDNKPALTVRQVDKLGAKTKTLKGIRAIAANEWHHIAGVYDVEYKVETVLEFLWNKKTFAKIPRLDKPLTAAASIDMWLCLKEAPEKLENGRYVPQILDNQILFTTTSADEDVFIGLYLDKNVPVFSVTTSQTTTIKAINTLRYDEWLHLAATFDGNTTLKLYLNGQEMELDSSPPEAEDQLAFLAPPNEKLEEGDDDPIVYSVGGQAGSAPYNGLMDELRLWNEELPIDKIRQYIKKPISGNEPGLVGYWPLKDRYGTTIMDLGGTSNGTLVGAKFTRVDKGFFSHRILLDGEEIAYEKVNEELIISEETPLLIGSDNYQHFLQATVDDVRLWKVGRMNWEIDYYKEEAIPNNADGLVSDWNFDTGKGKVAFDNKSENNAIISDSTTEVTEEDANLMWLATWFKSNWKFYINGKQIATEAYSLPIGYGNDQCNIGAMLLHSSVATFFSGKLNEMRLWNEVRTQEQIKDNLNRLLVGNEDGLIGYWPFKEGSGEIIGDYCGRAGNGQWLGVSSPAWSSSTAPISMEIPQIKNILGGIAKPDHITIQYGPSSATYSDLQVEEDDSLVGVLKRSNQYIKDNAFHLSTNFKVGDLDVQFVSQIQIRPTLIGFIEGAPPVPSENLTVDAPSTPDKYVGASTITLTEAENTAHTYTASRNTGFDMSVDTKIGFQFEHKTEAGLVVSTLLFGFISKIGLHANFEHSLGWLNDASYATESSISKKHTLDMAGGWEKNTYQLDGGKGRLYVPNNMGYALVKSGTADLYAMRNKNSGALVAYSVRSNPDIPEDYNIIMFKIDPTYIKNGTLDGYIGFQPDKDYSFLSPGVRGSYFKPLEAYALKQQIDREREQLKTFYEEFEAASIGRRENDTHFQDGDIGDAGNDLGKIILGAEDREGDLDYEQWKKEFAQRNLVNTYVWTADGGLFAEEEQFSAVRESSVGGSYDFVGKAGVYTEMGMNTGLHFELDALFGGHIRTSATKTKKEGASFGMSVGVTGEGFLNKTAAQQTPIPKGQYPILYDNSPAPGKVKGYRFMTFYLAPRKSNFDQFKNIVDNNWLNRQGDYTGTYDPDAFALRQALYNNNEVWSVKHRVTYVSRVPESTPSEEGESLSKAPHKPDNDSIESNALLIGLVPLSKNDKKPLLTLSDEINALLDSIKANTMWGSQIDLHRKEFKEDLMTYLKGYYELT
jgi:hypothetical protein